MLLAGDIGGTKTNLALYAPNGGLVAQAQTTFKSCLLYTSDAADDTSEV